MLRYCVYVISLVGLSTGAGRGEAAVGDEPAKDKAAELELPPAAARHVDYQRDIKPIFAKNCYRCHGPKAQKAGLRLDSRETAYRGGDSGPAFTRGKSAESLLIRRVSARDSDEVMPPRGRRLTSQQVGLLRAWIDQGARWSGEEDLDAGSRRRHSDHWSFQELANPEVPPVRDEAWVRNAIDAFVLRRLERLGVKPSSEADRPTLIRRLCLDLTGLPPCADEVKEFLADDSPGAYERLVERLLATPHFGERWGRHWLDLARYADSDGYEKDRPRPHAWRYRNWVLDAVNNDSPFDQFTVEQLAGDLLPTSTLEQKVATGFHRNTLTNTEGGTDQEEFRVKATVDRTNTTAAVWLGLTLGCAQCHSHKYDPITQREHYEFFAFFNVVKEIDIAAPLSAETENYRRAREAFDFRQAELKRALGEMDKDSPEAAELRRQLTEHAKTSPPKPTTQAQTLAKHSPRRRTHVLERGDFLRPGAEVEPNTPAVLPPLKRRGETPDRLDLARWLIDARNPLTPRVAANRIWQHLFGRGIVATPEDFGRRGDRPSHADLLDWLGREYMRLGWSLKGMVRLIVTSATYRQSSNLRADLLDLDSNNILLARQNRFRLEAEIVRDVYLASSGLMTRAVGGPSIRPPLPSGVRELGYANSIKWPESTGKDRYRRGLYIFLQRTVPYPMLTTFDAPESTVSCVKRRRSNTPLQALTLLNDPVFFECARALGLRVVRETNTRDVTDGMRHLFLLAVSRFPDRSELKRLKGLYTELLELYEALPEQARRVVDDADAPEPVVAAAFIIKTAAWIAVARVVLNLDEVVTRS